MGGYSLIQTHLCPACGRLMGLTRTIAARATANCALTAAGNAGYGSRKEAPQEISSSAHSLSAKADSGVISVLIPIVYFLLPHSCPAVAAFDPN
jgi:hypothetical protein